jgi:VanZ family protein
VVLTSHLRYSRPLNERRGLTANRDQRKFGVRRQSEAATTLLMTKPEIQSGVAPDKSGLPPHSKNRFWRYGPPIIWATLIFIGSSDLLSSSHTSGFIIRPLHLLFPHASEATLAAIHFALRKLGHFTEYAILAWLTARALSSSSQEWLRTRWFWVALAFVICYALFDEVRQSFVPSRTSSIYDSLIDISGGLTALLMLSWVRRRHENQRFSLR